ncbi:hypothetical protein OESDEN_15321 [Oesophagostomum dentatum]|uniref:Uncharacterized protein n=1 Tax=Oesophagostomum dentatum TaxID=61180 RepID=A0A0B1SP18_OESDE|nr:hypothetical protein OESDEN_15321 [Oesophagostomum dentatum]
MLRHNVPLFDPRKQTAERATHPKEWSPRPYLDYIGLSSSHFLLHVIPGEILFYWSHIYLPILEQKTDLKF